MVASRLNVYITSRTFCLRRAARCIIIIIVCIDIHIRVIVGVRRVGFLHKSTNVGHDTVVRTMFDWLLARV